MRSLTQPIIAVCLFIFAAADLSIYPTTACSPVCTRTSKTRFPRIQLFLLISLLCIILFSVLHILFLSSFLCNQYTFTIKQARKAKPGSLTTNFFSSHLISSHLIVTDYCFTYAFFSFQCNQYTCTSKQASERARKAKPGFPNQLYLTFIHVPYPCSLSPSPVPASFKNKKEFVPLIHTHPTHFTRRGELMHMLMHMHAIFNFFILECNVM